MKELHCRDVGFDCDAVVTGESLDDVLAKAAPHVEQVHRTMLTPMMAAAVQGVLRDAVPGALRDV